MIAIIIIIINIIFIIIVVTIGTIVEETSTSPMQWQSPPEPTTKFASSETTTTISSAIPGSKTRPGTNDLQTLTELLLNNHPALAPSPIGLAERVTTEQPFPFGEQVTELKPKPLDPNASEKPEPVPAKALTSGPLNVPAFPEAPIPNSAPDFGARIEGELGESNKDATTTAPLATTTAPVTTSTPTIRTQETITQKLTAAPEEAANKLGESEKPFKKLLKKADDFIEKNIFDFRRFLV